MEFDYNFTLLLLIFVRMSGCVLFNPILGRKNIPTIVRVALSLMLSFFTYPYVPPQTLQINSPIVFIVCAVKELLIGFLVGFIIQMIQSIIIMAGEQMDMQIGLSMSKIYDPQSNVSMPLSASLINAMFMLIFFLTNSHLTLIEVFVRLGAAVPYGDKLISSNIYQNIVASFGLMLIYAAKLSLPIIAVEMISQMGIGIMMKAVPQIDIFTIEIQLKLIIGFIVIMVLVPSFADFIEKIISLMFENISGVYSLLK
ncbi:MAG TPA: flagellar biosynthetic protein FliR [Caproicibacter sp.]|nr:flagellar biosynthetic protein FliR [Caproicibacter sp.]